MGEHADPRNKLGQWLEYLVLESNIKTLTEWTEFFGVHIDEVVDWLSGFGIPTPNCLAKVATELIRRCRAHNRWIYRDFKEIMQLPINEVTPISEQITQNIPYVQYFSDYYFSPILEECWQKLQARGELTTLQRHIEFRKFADQCREKFDQTGK